MEELNVTSCFLSPINAFKALGHVLNDCEMGVMLGERSGGSS